MTTLSVVIPATDAPLTLGESLAAIRSAEEPPEEIIVVDRPSRAGPAEARNLGASRATQDVLVFVDADVQVAPDVFRRLRRAFESRPELTALFGSYDDDPAAHGLVSDFRNLLHHHVHQQGAGPATTFWAGLGAIRHADFLASGWFDEERFPTASVEDIELGMRIAARGGRIELDPGLQGKHLKHWTLGNMVRTDLLRRGAPWVQLLIERKSSSTALNLGCRQRASVLSSLLLLAGLGTRRPPLAAGSLAAIVLLNHSFYLLLLRRRGWRQAAAGVPLHVLHQLLAAAAVPVGAGLYLAGRLDRPRSSS